MHHFTYRRDELFAEDIPVAELAARHGTPLYVYSAATLRAISMPLIDLFRLRT
jgi:diaminopimelate decarboxylase